jgi:hypothetical protein
LAARIDGQNGDLLSLFGSFRFADQVRAQPLDQAALARARNAGDANANGISAMRKAVFDDLLG